MMIINVKMTIIIAFMLPPKYNYIIRKRINIGEKMNIKTIVVGPLQENCYIIERGTNCLIIDPGDEAEKIISNIEKRVLGIILTHTHADHIGALNGILVRYNCPIYSKTNLQEGKFSIGNFSFEIIMTPGHTDDSISIYFKEDKVLFSGDFIFKNSIGRTDFKESSPFDMRQSIKKILKYPLDIRIYPGHYAPTTLGEEVNNLNYFMNKI